VEPITGEIPEGEVDPSASVGPMYEADRSKNSLPVGHVAEFLCNCTALLPSKPGFLEVLVECLDDHRFELKGNCSKVEEVDMAAAGTMPGE